MRFLALFIMFSSHCAAFSKSHHPTDWMLESGTMSLKDNEQKQHPARQPQLQKGAFELVSNLSHFQSNFPIVLKILPQYLKTIR